jgi:hypothetical protein
VVEHKVHNVTVNLLDEGLLRIGVCDREAVNAPGMAARPAGFVRLTLEGNAVKRLAGYGVELIMMIGGAVASDKIICGGLNPPLKEGERIVAYDKDNKK